MSLYAMLYLWLSKTSQKSGVRPSTLWNELVVLNVVWRSRDHQAGSDRNRSWQMEREAHLGRKLWWWVGGQHHLHPRNNCIVVRLIRTQTIWSAHFMKGLNFSSHLNLSPCRKSSKGTRAICVSHKGLGVFLWHPHINAALCFIRERVQERPIKSFIFIQEVSFLIILWLNKTNQKGVKAWKKPHLYPK